MTDKELPNRKELEANRILAMAYLQREIIKSEVVNASWDSAGTGGAGGCSGSAVAPERPTGTQFGAAFSRELQEKYLPRPHPSRAFPGLEIPTHDPGNAMFVPGDDEHLYEKAKKRNEKRIEMGIGAAKVRQEKEGESQDDKGSIGDFEDVIVRGDDLEEGFEAYYVKGDKVLAVASLARDPVVTRASELMRLGLMPSANEIRAGVELGKIKLGESPVSKKTTPLESEIFGIPVTTLIAGSAAIAAAAWFFARGARMHKA